MLWVVMALDIASLVSSYLQYGLLKSIDAGYQVSEEVANANDTREQLIGIVYFIAFVVCVITFIQWFRRASWNLHQRVPNLQHSEGWAAGAWFVPIISLYMPYQIMKELYKRTSMLLMQRGMPHEPPRVALVGWWWAAWIIGNILGQISFRTAMSAETMDELIFTTGASVVEGLFGIPLAILAVQVVKGYSKMEPLLAALPEAVPPPAPPPMVVPEAPDAVPPPAVRS